MVGEMRACLLWIPVGLGVIVGLLGLAVPAVADVLFDGPYSYPVGDAASGVAVGDVNGDLWPDLAVSNWDSHDVSLLLNNGDGTFAPAVHYATGRSAVGVALSDLNRDDWLDLVATRRWGENSLSVLLSHGQCLPGDVDGDHDVDLADLAGLLGAYDACDGDPDYDPDADFDASGCVDLWDLLTLLYNYGAGL